MLAQLNRTTRKISRFAALISVAFAFGSAQAEIVNISTQLDANSYQAIIAPGVTAVGEVLTLGAGNYTITPIDSAHGGEFTAENRFSSANVPYTGYEWNYYISINNGPATKVGFGGGSPAIDGVYQATAAAAFATAPTHSFTLTQPGHVTIYWADDNFNDNAGGASMNVAAVPEPQTYALMLVGIGLMAFTYRRRKAPDYGRAD
jgi:hypothetical protein